MTLSDDEKDLSLALIAALTNIKNCLRLKGKFTDDSLKNFKNNRENMYKIIEEKLNEDITSSEEWLKKLKELTESLNDESTTSVYNEISKCFTITNEDEKSAKRSLHLAIMSAFLHIKKSVCKDGYTNESFENYKSDKTIDYNLGRK